MLEISNLWYCVLQSWKLTSRDFWSSRNTDKPLSKLKHFFRKCSGVSQKWWMLEISNLCHCVQHPWKHTSRLYWSSRNIKKPLSKKKCILRKSCGVSLKWWMLEISQPLPLWFSNPENLLVGITEALGTQKNHFLSLTPVFRKCRGVSQKRRLLELSKSLPLCSAPLKTY